MRVARPLAPYENTDYLITDRDHQGAPPATIYAVSRPGEDFDALFRAGNEAWELFREKRGAAFHAFVPADYPMALEVLRSLRPRASSFLELGSGVGVITIVAAILGFEACGIEIDPWLAQQSEDLADEFGVEAHFAAGSFIPEEFQGEVDLHQTELPSILHGNPGFHELERDLDDFDLVYAFYWPGLDELFFELMRRHGQPGGLLLTYGGIEGYRLWRDGEELSIH